MASLCPKCGAELSPGTQFCTACGTPTGAAAAISPAVQPAAAPSGSGSSALKVILIIIAVIAGLGILGAGVFGFFVWRVAHSIHVSSNGNTVELNTPQGRISANTTEYFTASDLGTDVYPGAQSGKGGMRMTLPTGTMVSAVYLTSDSKDQVIAFYKSKLGSNASLLETSTGSVLTLNRNRQDSIVVTVTLSPSEYEGKTQIHIVHTTATKPS